MSINVHTSRGSIAGPRINTLNECDRFGIDPNRTCSSLVLSFSQARRACHTPRISVESRKSPCPVPSRSSSIRCNLHAPRGRPLRQAAASTPGLSPPDINLRILGWLGEALQRIADGRHGLPQLSSLNVAAPRPPCARLARLRSGRLASDSPPRPWAEACHMETVGGCHD